MWAAGLKIFGLWVLRGLSKKGPCGVGLSLNLYSAPKRVLAPPPPMLKHPQALGSYGNGFP